MGLVNSPLTISSLSKRVKEREIDLVIHLGDIAGADAAYLDFPFSFRYEDYWDEFMKSIEPIAAYVPYMVVPGHHDAECHSPICTFSREKLEKLSNFSAFNSRFKMPSDSSKGAANMWYSFDVGSAHIICLDSETDYDHSPSSTESFAAPNGKFGDQMSWFQNDLNGAVNVNSKQGMNWIIAASHRPLYSIAMLDNSGNTQSATRNFRRVFEDGLESHHVDMIFSGYVHGYERQLPVFHESDVQRPVHTSPDIFTSSKHVMQIVNGAAGNRDGFSVLAERLKIPSWNTIRDFQQFGYGILEIQSEQLIWKYYSSEQGLLLDQVSILKNHVS
jgi:hypothetical protein